MHSMPLHPGHPPDDIFYLQIRTASNLQQRLGYVPGKHG